MTVLFGVLLWRVFYLQIVKGEKYQDNYTLKIVKERTLNSTRGNIYDRNGELLAYNELAYSITIEDNGSYSSTDKNESLNAEIAQVITALEKNGDAITDDFKIDRTGEGTYEFNVTVRALGQPGICQPADGTFSGIRLPDAARGSVREKCVSQ